MLCYHDVLIRYRIRSHIITPWVMQFTPEKYHFLHASDSKGNQSDLSDTNVSKDEDKLGSNPKLKIVSFGKPLEPFVLLIEDGSSHVRIPGIDVAILATPILVIPIQSIAPSKKKGESDDVNFKEELAHVPLSFGSHLSIERKPSFDKDLFDSGSRLDGSKSQVRSYNQCSFTGTLSVASLESSVRRISIFNIDAVMTEVDKNLARVFGKAILDKAMLTTFMPSSIKEVPASFHYRVRLKGTLSKHIDIINANEVMDTTIKASLGKTEAYIKESFEDLKNF
ncbi:hypothetical protein Cgig2_026630 [Carnegiea gigantea]|uniref:Uncharacterized protein n=1 Tax=Carnegiea gigantea TaxID=171969 RepID=A0A9Q1Q930_9CARY|nr:hypothetical protein Cgig2_026630 [Carnegiea gigantea]